MAWYWVLTVTVLASGLYILGGTITLLLQKYVFNRFDGNSATQKDAIWFSFVLWPIMFLFVLPLAIGKKIGLL